MSNFSKIYIADEVARILELHADLVSAESRSKPICSWLDAQARRVFEAHAEGDPCVFPHIACWHPTLVGKSVDEILAALFSLDDARLTIAREYGFADWETASVVTDAQSEPFEEAVDRLLSGDVAGLRNLLKEKPGLATERSLFGHRATLLHYIGSNGVETWRQVVPLNLAEVTRVVLDAGADVNATAKIYGESRTLGLLTSSAHPAEAGVVDEVAEILRAHGAEQ